MSQAARHMPSATDQAARLRLLVAGSDAARLLEASPTSASKAPIITIASGKGGVGKTTLAVNLSIALAAQGLRTTLVDADLGTANADLLCGLLPHARLEHVVQPLLSYDGGFCDIRDIAVDAPGGFKLIPGAAGVGRMADLNGSERLMLIQSIRRLESDNNIILVDAAAGIGESVTCLAHASHLVIVLATPEPTAIADAYALIKCLVMGSGAQIQSRLRLVVNEAASRAEAEGVHRRMAAVCKRFLGTDLKFSGWIAQDMRVSEAVRARKPLMLGTPHADAAERIRCLGADLAHELRLCTKTAQRSAPGPRRGLFSRIFGTGRSGA